MLGVCLLRVHEQGSMLSHRTPCWPSSWYLYTYIHTYIHKYIHIYIHFLSQEPLRPRLLQSLSTCYDTLQSQSLYVTMYFNLLLGQKLTLRRERQWHVSSLPKGTYVCGPPHLNSDPKVPDVANLQLHTLTN